MKFYLTIFSFFVIFIACEQKTEQKNNQKTVVNDKISEENNFGIILHGGAGTILKEHMSDSLEAAYKFILEKAITKGYEVLKNEGTSLEAIAETIKILEDSPLFNAGKGAVFTNQETNELDASVMVGNTLDAGAISGVTRVKNPIDLAIKVMTHSPHVMLSGQGAEHFAAEHEITLVDPSYFFTENRFQSLQHIKETEKDQTNLDSKTSAVESYFKDSKFGTVGAAALDKHGNLAAGTSTGGMTNKKWNRIGDSPIIGAGTYANNNTCAVSSTGWGEYFIRAVVAHDISALMDYKGLSLQEAAQEVIQKKVPALGGDGGIIAIDKNGNMVAEFNTEGMYRASINAQGEVSIGIFKE